MLFGQNFNLSASQFNELPPQDQYQIFNDLKFLVRSNVFGQIAAPGKISNKRLLKQIDKKVEDILFN